jgi:hypothetical protein
LELQPFQQTSSTSPQQDDLIPIICSSKCKQSETSAELINAPQCKKQKEQRNPIKLTPSDSFNTAFNSHQSPTASSSEVASYLPPFQSGSSETQLKDRIGQKIRGNSNRTEIIKQRERQPTVWEGGKQEKYQRKRMTTKVCFGLF